MVQAALRCDPPPPHAGLGLKALLAVPHNVTCMLLLHIISVPALHQGAGPWRPRPSTKQPRGLLIRPG